jgi:hypothetical protein
LEENKDRCPEWYDPEKHKKKMESSDNSSKSSDEKEVANAAVNCGPKLLLMTMDYCDATESEMCDPNIWIADTGTTCDVSPYLQGAMKFVNNTSEIQQVQLENVKFVPTAKFNTFSLTKRMINGWKLCSDENKMELVKGDKKVTFSIKI